MKNEKGVTLIELLAVVLILSIILLIAVPTISKMVDDSKKRSFETSVNNLVGSIEDKCYTEKLKRDGSEVTRSYTLDKGEITPFVDMRGTLPPSGTINVSLDCEVELEVTDNNRYTVRKEYSDEKASIVED